MKRILLALAIFALVLPATQRAEARVDVSVDFFYNNLTSGGNWVEVGDYGYCWQPSVAVSNRDWRPYTDGYWAYTDVGWTWVSYEDFGWATYHYGRWARVREQGWVWVPGREWGPAWVSWRTGGDYVGWAPLPPRRGYVSGGEVVYEGRPITGYVDIDFDIGPAYYSFVDIRYIGEPVLRQRILPQTQNVTYITGTVNVTNITYNNSTVYNYGPDYNRLSAYSTRPIQRLTLQRETSTDLDAALKSGAMTKVEGNTLMVAAPQEFKAAGKGAAPKEVKTKIAKSELETGWSGISDEKQKTELQAQMKREDRKSIPPPKIEPQNPQAATAPSPGATAAPSAPADAENGRGPDKGREKGRGKPAPAVAPGPESTPSVDEASENAQKTRGNRKEKASGKPAPTPMGTPVQESSGRNDRKGRDKRLEPGKPANAPAVPAEANEPAERIVPPGRGGKQKLNKLPDMQTSERPLMPERKIERQPSQMEAPAPASEGENGQGRGNRKAERMNVPQPPPQASENAPAPREQPVMRKERQMAPQQMAPPRGADNAPAQGGRPGKEKGNRKDKKGDEEPPPEG